MNSYNGASETRILTRSLTALKAPARTKTTIAIAMTLIARGAQAGPLGDDIPVADMAAVAQTSPADPSRSSADTPDVVRTARDQASSRDAAHPIFWKAGQALQNLGITPSLVLTQMYLQNPSAGQQTGNHEALTFVAVGADFDLKKLVGIPGATIHFQQLLVPFVVNTSYGTQVGDSIAGQPSPYVAQKAHLTLFTWEQKFLDGRATVEFGKSNAGNYFAVPVCELPYGCLSPILQDSGQINPIIYSNWGARAAYTITNEITAQVGWWKSDSDYPDSNGWNWSTSSPQSNTYLANLTYKTDPMQDRYAKSYEALYYYNTASHTDSKSPGPVLPGPYKGTSGLYIGGKQVVWHPDGEIPGTPGAFSLSVFGNLSTSFDQHNAAGLSNTAMLGLMARGLLKSRPYDSVSVRVTYTRMTDAEQTFLRGTNLALGGNGYNVSRNEYALQLDANILVTPSVILSPYIQRTFNTNSWLMPYYGGKPRNGVAYGVLMTFLFDKMLGLSGS